MNVLVSGIHIYCECMAISTTKHVSILYWNMLQKASCTKNCRNKGDSLISAQQRYVKFLDVTIDNILQSEIAACIHNMPSCRAYLAFVQL